MSKKSQAEADQSRQARKRTPTFLLELPLQIDEGQAAHGTQRDLYSAFLAAYLDPAIPIPSCAQYVVPWEGTEARLRAAHERVQERAKAGQVLPQSFGIPRAGVRLPESLREPPPEPVLLLRGGRLEAWQERSEPRCFSQGSFQKNVT